MKEGWKSSRWSVVQCKSFETPTPGYLIPHYLWSVRSHFRHYASVRKGNEWFMTVEDLLSALLALPAASRGKIRFTSHRMRAIFEDADVDKDGLVSLNEFRLLAALLNLQSRDISILFRLVDREQKGTVNVDQFAQILFAVTSDPALYRFLCSTSGGRGSGLVSALFGSQEKPKECSEADLVHFVSEIEEQLWEADFMRFGAADKLTPEDFGQLITDHTLGTHPPHYIAANIQKLHRGPVACEAISLPVWIAFKKVVKRAKEVADVLSLYTASGNQVRRENIDEVLQAAGVPPLPSSSSDLLFAVFDRNGDGVIDLEECLAILAQRQLFYYHSPAEGDMVLGQRIFRCTTDFWQAWK